MKDKGESQILEELRILTKAQVIEPNETDLEEKRELEEQRRRSERDRTVMATLLAKKRKEEMLLRQARGELEESGKLAA
jgi:large subunit ribosomal protein MRP49